MPQYSHFAELAEYFENGLWLSNASHANDMAKHLRSTLQSQNSTSLPDEKGNIVFQYIPNQETLEKLKAVGCSPYQWPKPWDHRPSKNRYRLVVPWNAKQEDVDLVSKIINEGRLSKNHMNELDEPEQQAVVGLG